MLNVKYVPVYTYDDYKQWKGDWELIEGFPFAMAPSPTASHQKVSGKIITALNNAIEKCVDSQVSVYVELDWIVSDITVLRPDISVVCKEIKDYLKETPEAIFEVISKNTVIKDEELKFEIYRKEGVKFYFLVYPEIKKIRAFKLNNHKEYEKFFDSDSGILTFKVCNNCQITIEVEKLFI